MWVSRETWDELLERVGLLEIAAENSHEKLDAVAEAKRCKWERRPDEFTMLWPKLKWVMVRKSRP